MPFNSGSTIRKINGARMMNIAVVRMPGHSKALIPAVAKQVVAEHTSYLVGANKALIEKKEGAAKRVDIAGGGAPEVRVRPLKPEDVRGMTDEEILDMA